MNYSWYYICNHFIFNCQPLRKLTLQWWKKINKKLGLVSLIIMLLGILGLTNLVNPLL